MKKGMTRHLTPGSAVALLALIVALGGTAVAASTLADGSVTTAKLANSAVKKAKLANSAVTSPKLANGSVTTPKLANSAVTGAKVAAGTLEASDFTPDVLGGISSSKVTTVTGKVTIPAGKVFPVFANCPPNQAVLSGGYELPGPVLPGDNNSIAVVIASRPSVTAGNISGWTVTVAASTVVDADVTAFAVCAAP